MDLFECNNRIIKSEVLDEIVLFTISFFFRLYISNYKANSKKNILQCVVFFYRSVYVTSSHTHFEIYFTLFFNTLLLFLLGYFCVRVPFTYSSVQCMILYTTILYHFILYCIIFTRRFCCFLFIFYLLLF